MAEPIAEPTAETMADSVPETPEALTAQWLGKILGFAVRSVRQEVLGQGQGFMGDIVRLHLDSDSDACPATIIAKLPKLANRGMGEMLGVYEREVLFFEELGPKIPSRIPTIFFSHQDRDRGSEQQKGMLSKLDRAPGFLMPLIMLLGKRVASMKNRRYLLLMEDLAQFQPGDQFVGAPVATCQAVLEAIAATHRAHWQSPALQDHFWLLPLDIDARMRHRMYAKTIPEFKTLVDPNLHPHLDWLQQHGARLMQAFAADAPQTLLHCDLRLDNICFDGTHCAFLDWQLTRAGPAAYDVAYFIGSAMATDVDHAEELSLLHSYHQALDAPDYPFATFQRDYQRALMLTYPSLAPLPDIAIDAGRGQEMMNRWRARIGARLLHVNLATLLD